MNNTALSKPIDKKTFTKMNKKRRIVFLAKDVLMQLKNASFVELHGSFINLINKRTGGYVHIADYSRSAHDILNTRDNQCHVCAKGALVCSYVKNFNGVTMANFKVNHNDEMSELFGSVIWDEIENAFEGFHQFQRHSMEELMKNLIKNKGNFDTKVLRLKEGYIHN